MEDAAIATAMEAEKAFLSNSGYLTAYERPQKYLRDMRAMKEYDEEVGWEKGLAEGRAEATKEMVLALHRKMGMPAPKISELFDISLAEVESYIRQGEQ